MGVGVGCGGRVILTSKVILSVCVFLCSSVSSLGGGDRARSLGQANTLLLSDIPDPCHPQSSAHQAPEERHKTVFKNIWSQIPCVVLGYEHL